MRRSVIVCAALEAACGVSTAPVVRAPVIVPDCAASAGAPSARSSPPDDPPWRADERFRVRVEQDGADVPVVDRRVVLARRAFTFVFQLAGIDAIDVNMSYAPATLDLARNGASLTGPDDVFGDGHGAAEERDPPHGVFVDDEAFNLWGWGEDMHRCHAREAPPGKPYTVCKRIVESLRRRDELDAPIERTPARELYVVAMSTTAGPARWELQRAWLTIVLR